jgi:predicted ATPase/transcriptional regulator with XRE-family HTH domain
LLSQAGLANKETVASGTNVSVTVVVEGRPKGSSDFGTLLRRYRLAAGLSQEALAERARMSTNGIGALERGYRHTPQRETLALLTGALSLTQEQRDEFEAAAARSSLPRRRSPVTVDPWADTAPSNLPVALTSFIGRETEVDEIATLARDHRMVTLTGAGGVGKTQTALQVANALNQSLEKTIHFVALAPVGDPSLVVAAIASALGVQGIPNRPLLQQVLAYLENKTVLLILDNCEHVIEEAALVAATLLSACSGIRIIATSRERLKAAGEYAYRLPSLDSLSAVALFADRARAVDHRFALNDGNVAVVTEICRRLDGIPLAIELAAARVNALSLPTLAEKLDDSFRLLGGGTRTGPRQQTMRATMEWSYDLLSERERRVFRRLAVFAGGCTLGMAASVCLDEGQDDAQMLDLLSSLVDKSLVAAEVSTDATRYVLLETTRQYARERLAEFGELDAMAERHARALLGLLREITSTETGYNARLDRPPKTIRTMYAERANLDEAMNWTLKRRKNTRLGQELAWRIPFLRATDALHWLGLALEAVDEGTPSELALNVEIQLGWCFVDVRDHENAIMTARRAVTASRNLGDVRLVAAARRLLGRALTHAWKLDEAELELQKALTSWREIGDRRAIATTLSYLAFVAVRRGAYSRARRLNLDALDALGNVDERHARLIKIELARAEYGLGNYEVALAYSREVLPALEAEAADGGLTCVILMLNQCTFLVALDRFDEAFDVARRALAATLDAQNPRPDLVPYVAGALAKVAVLRTGPRDGTDRTTRLENCVKLIAWNDAVCIARGESDPDETFEEVAMLRRELGHDRIRRLLTEGARLDNTKAIALMQML